MDYRLDVLLMIYVLTTGIYTPLQGVKNTYLCILPVKSSIIKYFVEVNMSNVLTYPNLLIIYNPLGGFIITLETQGSDYIKRIAVPFLRGNHFHRIF